MNFTAIMYIHNWENLSSSVEKVPC